MVKDGNELAIELIKEYVNFFDDLADIDDLSIEQCTKVLDCIDVAGIIIKPFEIEEQVESCKDIILSFIMSGTAEINATDQETNQTMKLDIEEPEELAAFLRNKEVKEKVK